MKIVVLGATGGVGRQVVEQGLARGHHVTAFARHEHALVATGRSVRLICGDAKNPDDVMLALTGQDAVLCTLGADTRGVTDLYSAAARNLCDAMPARGVSRLVFLSNFGVFGESSPHPVTACLSGIARFALKGTLADHSKALNILKLSSLDWTAVRPMALTNGPSTGKILRIGGRASSGWVESFTGGCGLVHARSNRKRTFHALRPGTRLLGREPCLRMQIASITTTRERQGVCACGLSH